MSEQNSISKEAITPDEKVPHSRASDRVEINECRRRELSWMGEVVQAVQIRGDPLHCIHLYGASGSENGAVIQAWLNERRCSPRPYGIWSLENIFRVTPMVDCFRQLLSTFEPSLLHDHSEVAQALRTLNRELEAEHRTGLADGRFLLYSNFGGISKAGNRGTYLDRHRFSGVMTDAWMRLWKSVTMTGEKGDLLMRVSELVAIPREFQWWIGHELTTRLRRENLPWPVILLTSGHDVFERCVAVANGVPSLAAPITQMNVKPLAREVFQAWLQNRGFPRESWDWIFEECGGFAGRTASAWHRWLEHQEHRKPAPGWSTVLGIRLQPEPSPTEWLWIQSAAGLGGIDEELQGLVFGIREGKLAAGYLLKLPCLDAGWQGDIPRIETVVETRVLGWMTVHAHSFLERCRECAELYAALRHRVPRRRDRAMLSLLAPLPEIDASLLEAVFPEDP